MYISIGPAALSLGVSVSSIRRWEKNGTLLPHHITKGGHRRYSLIDIQKCFLSSKNEATDLTDILLTVEFSREGNSNYENLYT